MYLSAPYLCYAQCEPNCYPHRLYWMLCICNHLYAFIYHIRYGMEPTQSHRLIRCYTHTHTHMYTDRPRLYRYFSIHNGVCLCAWHRPNKPFLRKLLLNKNPFRLPFACDYFHCTPRQTNKRSTRIRYSETFNVSEEIFVVIFFIVKIQISHELSQHIIYEKCHAVGECSSKFLFHLSCVFACAWLSYKILSHNMYSVHYTVHGEWFLFVCFFLIFGRLYFHTCLFLPFALSHSFTSAFVFMYRSCCCCLSLRCHTYAPIVVCVFILHRHAHIHRQIFYLCITRRNGTSNNNWETQNHALAACSPFCPCTIAVAAAVAAAAPCVLLLCPSYDGPHEQR